MLTIGHRGAAGVAPENTLPAFQKAVQVGLDMAELDVQLTKDQQLVVIHDQDLSRVAGCSAKVKDLTLRELKELEVGSWWDEEYVGEQVPTLAEVIEVVKGELKLNIELKPGLEDPSLVIEQVVDLLQEKNFIDQVIVSSFNHQLVKQVKELNPNLTTAVLMAACSINPVAVIDWANADGLHLEQAVVNKKVVTEVKAAGYFINAWTVNKLEIIEQFRQLGVTGIITDYPDLMGS